jgi:hypothetical protein
VLGEDRELERAVEHLVRVRPPPGRRDLVDSALVGAGGGDAGDLVRDAGVREVRLVEAGDAVALGERVLRAGSTGCGPSAAAVGTSSSSVKVVKAKTNGSSRFSGASTTTQPAQRTAIERAAVA